MLNELLGMIQNFSIPVPVTLVCACACAYLIGKIPSDLSGRTEASSNRRKAVRGKKLVNRLAGELNLLREDLRLHDQCIRQLLDAIERLEAGEEVSINPLAEQALRSIQTYATEFQQHSETIQATTATAVNTLLAEQAEAEGSAESNPSAVQVSAAT